MRGDITITDNLEVQAAVASRPVQVVTGAQKKYERIS